MQEARVEFKMIAGTNTLRATKAHAVEFEMSMSPKLGLKG